MPVKEKLLGWINPYIRIPTAGLDISDRTLKFLKFLRGNKLDFEIWGEIEIPAGLIESGEIKKEEELIKHLSSWRRGLARSFSSEFIAASLPEEKSFLRVIQLPKVKREEVVPAVRWEIEANIPMPAEDLIYDYEIIEPPDDDLDHLDVVVTAFPKTVVESYARVLSGAGFKLYTFELESQAIVRALVPTFSEKTARIIVDLGRHRSSIILFARDAIIFTTTLKFGGLLMEEEISRSLDVSPEKALEIKKIAGLNKKEYEGKLFSALLASLETLTNALKTTLDYYRNRTAHIHGVAKTVDEIILAGGDANLTGLDTYLSASLKVPVKLADPWSGIKSKLAPSIPPIPRNQALGFTTTIGLAMQRF